MEILTRYLSNASACIGEVDNTLLEQSFELIKGVSESGGTIFAFGNGGSASICSHLAIDLSNACGIKARSWPDISVMTCLSNDYGYDQALVKYLERHFSSEDGLILVSSSGNSANMVNAAEYVGEKFGTRVIQFSGFDRDNKLNSRNAINLWVNSRTYNVVELVHQAWVLALVEELRAWRSS